MNSNSVDLVYLDPPFNSNRNYEAPIGSEAAGAAFKDMWTLDDIDVHEHGELADRNPGAYSVIESARQVHGKGMMSYCIFMAVRLLELERILKDSGSIYLHCDDAASLWLRALMDAIFGTNLYQNEITWKRTSAHNDSTSFGRVSDRILFYGSRINREAVRIVLDENYVRKHYRHRDGNHDRFGPVTLSDLTGPKRSYGESGETWNGFDPGEAGRCWSVPKTGDYAEWIDHNIIPGYKTMQGVHERLDALNSHDMIIWSKNGYPSLKRYLASTKGQIPSDIWTDITGAFGKEKTGYPTQKPLALLDRIIKASSNEDDMVFDPFCGCATSLVAADRLQRQWAGIDLSPLAVKLVNERIIKDRGSLWGKVIVPDQPPTRTDLGKLPNYRTHRHRLYGEQEGICVGCDTHFPFRVMEVDHILPRSRGGTDHQDNLQLLCSGCNKSKGSDTMAEWRARQ
ncbi:MAG: hypothetical protein F4093_09020 [Gammaproteobacteria bacterium]|nr:hypothetical protein [Gammaproteobacteria bacterium]